MSESEWQHKVIAAAMQLGWQWLHIGQTKGRPNQGVRGTLFKGFPDLMLVKGGRLIFAELKAEKGSTDPIQKQVLGILQQVGEVYIWRPSDFGQVLDTLAV